MAFEKSLEHRLLPAPFSILTFTGAWCPSYFSPFKKTLYHFYSACVFFSQMFIMSEMLSYVVECVASRRFEPWPVFILTTLINSMYKWLSARRKDWIVSIIDMGFSDRWRIPRNSSEEQLINDFNQKSRRVYSLYLVVFVSTTAFKGISPFFEKGEDTLKLPVGGRFFYDINVPAYFWLTFCQELFTGFIMCGMIMCTDILLSAVLLQVCLQMKLIKHRLIRYKQFSTGHYQKLPFSEMRQLERKTVKEFINDHLFIYKFTEKINKSFFGWIVSLYVVGTPNLCMNAYLMMFSTNKVDVFVSVNVFLVCFAQIILLCWCGNEISLHSIDLGSAVYEMDWINLSNSVKRDLTLITLRASKPVKLTVGSIIPLNIDSMINITKTAYSALNVLRRT